MTCSESIQLPFSWEERKPVLLDHFLYVPPQYERHDQWEMKEWENIFLKKVPIFVEYCSGNGQWIVDRAQAHPEICWVAVEKRFDRAQKIWKKRNRLGINNLWVVCSEAFVATQYYFPKNAFERCFINFPDPWPKNRHAKNRLMKENFLQELSLCMKEKGEGVLVTDHPKFKEEVVQTLLQSNFFQPTLPKPYFTDQIQGYGTSFFLELWQSKGCTIHAIPFHRSN